MTAFVILSFIPAPTPASPATQAKAPPVQQASAKQPAKGPVKESELRALEAEARRSPTAKSALLLYDNFAAIRQIPPSLRSAFDAARTVWAERSREGLVRLGTKWVSPADADKAREAASELVRQALEMTKILNFKEARRTLEKASRTDPNSFTADFSLGLLNSILPAQFRHAPTAARHFQEVLHRSPGYVPALNNLAIAEVRMDRHADAVRHWKQAFENSPTSSEVPQNLGRFISEARLGRIRPQPAVVSDATTYYAKIVTRQDAAPAELRAGWLFIPLVPAKEEKESLEKATATGPSSRIWDSGQGTGFVVDAHHVLTCRHVVEHPVLGQADRVEIIDPSDPTHTRRLTASIVDVDNAADLALVKCDALKAPAVAFASTIPARGTEILVIGFPGGSQFGLGLKTTRGIITALPGAVANLGGPKGRDLGDALWYDAATSHGASGCPVCDEHANVVAVHALGYRPGDDPTNAKYSGGVPSTEAARFVSKAIPGFIAKHADTTSLKWTEVDAKIGPSAVLITVGHRKVTMTIAVITVPSSTKSDIYEDRLCTACDGSGRLKCPVHECHKGVVPYDVPVRAVVGADGIGVPTVVNSSEVKYRRCDVCGGAGAIACPHCVQGVDKRLR